MEKESQGVSPETSREEKFVRAKQKVKAWETEYLALNGCRPDKDALASAPHDIRTAYKVYCYYRKALDGSRNASSMPSGKSESSSVSMSKCDLETSQNALSVDGDGTVALDKQKESYDNKSEQITHPVSNEESGENVSSEEKPKSSVWGRYLNKVAYVETPKTQENSLYSKMAAKLRESGSVKVRTSLKKLTPGNRFKKSNLTTSSTNKNISESEPSALDSNSVDKENFTRSDPQQFSNDTNDAPFPSYGTEENLSQEDTQSPDSRLFASLDNCERQSSQHSEALSIESKLNSVCSDDFGINANLSNLDASGSFHDLASASKIPFRVQKSQSVVKPISRPLNTFSSSIINEENLENNCKKRSSLNKGWLARCVGSDADLKLDPSEYTETDDSWKMKLIDREWTSDVEENDHNGEEENSHLFHPNAIEMQENSEAPRGKIKRSKKKNICTQENNEDVLDSRMEQNDDNQCIEVKVPSNKTKRQKAIKSGRGRTRRGRGQKGVITTRGTRRMKQTPGGDGDHGNFDEDDHDSDHGNLDDDEDCINQSFECDYAEGDEDYVVSEKEKNCNIYDFDGNMEEEEEAVIQIVPRRVPSRRCKTRSCAVEVEEPTDNDSEVGTKRRREEDLDALEQSGKIKSSWPPPKRVRKARTPTSKTAGSRRKVDNIKYSAVPVVLPEECESEPTKVKRTRQRKKATISAVSNLTRTVRKPKSSGNARDVLDDPCRTAVPSSSQETKVIRPKKILKRNISVIANDDSDDVVKKSDDDDKTSLCENKGAVNMKDYDELDDIESGGKKSMTGKKYLSTEDRLRKKVLNGSANNNYVRINLKKKTYVRGKKYMNLGKYKRNEWKKKKLMKSAEEGDEVAKKTLTCFKCGDFGHWARNCSGKKGDNLRPLEEYDENESTFLSLEDAAALARGIKPSSTVTVSKLHDVDPPTTKEKPDEECNGDTKTDKVKSVPENPPLQESSTVITEKEVSERDENMADNHNKTTVDSFLSDGLDDELFSSVSETCESSSVPTSTQVYASATSTDSNFCNRPIIDPLYELENDSVIPTTKEVFGALKLFGYSSFRAGQEDAIMRILSGMSTLLVLSTGSGKSLCYQLPAYLYAKRSNCITLCISPLVSLMEDQVSGLPKFLRAVCLHTHQNSSQRTLAINAIQSGNAQILLVSPEAIVGAQSGGILSTLLKDLPPVAFACLDEAHCVSEWSHNFRPSYLRVCKVLRERLGVRTILGLTATARNATAHSIAEQLNITNFDEGIIRGASVPNNLLLSVSRDEVREQALIALIQGDRFSSCPSIIVYCTRRDECERIATLIRTQLMEPSKVDVKKNIKRVRALSYDAEAYHAGLSSYRRQQVQKQFMSGKLRIVVATVAFGMGIDKSDVRGIIHFNMPRNIESYVQEIGRAGRDGEIAHCHLFQDARDGKDIQELKRHIYANSLDRGIVRKLLDQVFRPCFCQNSRRLKNTEKSPCKSECNTNPPRTPNQCLPSGVPAEQQSPKDANVSEEIFPVFESSSCPKHEVALCIDDLVQKLDLPEENLETLLCYLELHWSNLVKINSRVYANCSVSCYGGPRQLVAVSRRCPPLAAAIALECEKGVNMDKSNKVSFPVVEIASRMGWNSKIVKRELKALEWDTQNLPIGGKVKRSGVSVEFSDLSFHIEARGDLSDDERDQLLDSLFRRIQLREKEQLRQLHYTYQLLHSVSHKTILLCCDDVDLERCSKLREELSRYFAKEGKILSDVRVEEQVYINPDLERQICNSVRSVLSTHVDHRWTGRAMARVFHGISSPNFPAEVWGRVRQIWRLYLNVDFNLLVKVTTQEIIRCK